jgi:predicted MFS family arabinose efflux permease
VSAGYSTAFLALAAIAALGFVLYFALMPETRGAVRAGSEPESGGGRTPAVPVRA